MIIDWYFNIIILRGHNPACKNAWRRRWPTTEGWCRGECREMGTELGRRESKKCRIAGKGFRISLELAEPRGSTQLSGATQEGKEKVPQDSDPHPDLPEEDTTREVTNPGREKLVGDSADP